MEDRIKHRLRNIEWEKKNPDFMRNWRSKNEKKMRDYARNYYVENADRLKARRRESKSYTKYGAQYAKANPEKCRARKEITRGVLNGTIVRPDHCMKCGLVCKPEAHHHRGYDFPLEIMWLCRPCHLIAEGKIPSVLTLGKAGR